MHRFEKPLLVLIAIFAILYLGSCYKDDFLNPPTKTVFDGDLCLPVAHVTWHSPDMHIPDIEPEINDSILFPDSLKFAWIKFSKFRESFDFDISGTVEKPEYIQRLEINLFVTNQFPGQLTAQIYFVDGNNNIIDSVFQNSPFICAKSDMDMNGQLHHITSVYNNVILDTATFRNFHNSRNIRLAFQLENRDFTGQGFSDEEVIRYFSYYENLQIEVFMSMRISFKLNIGK